MGDVQAIDAVLQDAALAGTAKRARIFELLSEEPELVSMTGDLTPYGLLSLEGCLYGFWCDDCCVSRTRRTSDRLGLAERSPVRPVVLGEVADAPEREEEPADEA